MPVTVTLPVAYADVPKELERLRGELTRIDTEKNVVRALIEGVQACCPHTNVRRYSSMGESCANCGHCGKSLY